jgi:UDP-GlcNAc3NAcA epimerase
LKAIFSCIPLRQDAFMKRVMTIVGARPQFIKLAPFSRALSAAGLQELSVHTGQHYDAKMSDIFFEELKIPPPQFHLSVSGGGHGAQTGQMLVKVEEVMLEQKPDLVVVFGDTNSTLAGALAAAKLHIPVAHIEAGLRSFNRKMPEEVNRVLTDHLSNWLFVPTVAATENLKAEGITQGVHVVGDLMFDNVLYFRSQFEAAGDALCKSLGLKRGEYYFSTLHRAENVDHPQRLLALLKGLNDLGAPVVLPVHPRTKGMLARMGFELNTLEWIKAIEPVGYQECLGLAMHSKAVATDSGGLQKEAALVGRPVLILRDETEWVELIETGWAKLVDMTHSFSDQLKDLESQPQAALNHHYGDGKSAEKIVSVLNG